MSGGKGKILERTRAFPILYIRALNTILNLSMLVYWSVTLSEHQRFGG